MAMAENNNTGGGGYSQWDMRISPDSIRSAASEIDVIVQDIHKTYMAINDEIGVTLQNWTGQAQDQHVKMFNQDAELYNDYMDDMQYNACRLSLAGEAYAKTETKNSETGSALNDNIF